MSFINHGQVVLAEVKTPPEKSEALSSSLVDVVNIILKGEFVVYYCSQLFKVGDLLHFPSLHTDWLVAILSSAQLLGLGDMKV